MVCAALMTRPFPRPVEGGFSYEVAARAVYGSQYLLDAGPPELGARVCVILEWRGVDQQEVRGEVVQVESDDRVEVRLEWTGASRRAVTKAKAYAGVLVRGRPDLAASSASRDGGVWRLASLVEAKPAKGDAEPT